MEELNTASHNFDVLEMNDADNEYTVACNVYNKNMQFKCYVRLDCVKRRKLFKRKIVQISSSNDKLNNRLAAIQEIQQHPVNERLIHLDCYLIDPSFKNLRIDLPVKYVGTNAPIFKQNTTLYTTYYMDVKVSSLKHLLPCIEVDVSKMQGEMTIRQNQVPLPEGITKARRDNPDVCTMHSKA